MARSILQPAVPSWQVKSPAGSALKLPAGLLLTRERENAAPQSVQEEFSHASVYSESNGQGLNQTGVGEIFFP